MKDEAFLELDSLDDNQFNYLQKLSKPSNTIYNFILITMLVIIAALPFIPIDITTSAPASIQTNNLSEILSSPLPGKIALLRMENNHPVERGDTIMTIDNSQVDEEIKAINDRRQVVKQSLHDVDILRLSFTGMSSRILYTTQYQSQFAHYVEQKALLTAKLKNAAKTFKRFAYLYRQKVIPSSEYEKYELEYNQALSDVRIHETNTRAQWQTNKFALQQELDNLSAKESQLRGVEMKSAVIANISGTGYTAEGIQNGSFVQSGQKVGEIIPNNNLIAVCLISPKDIGFIKKNQKLRLQIDAYNYYDWGILNATVTEIVKDVSIVDNKPFYVIHCKMEKTFLTLQSGYKGSVIKGMTGRANFNLTTKTLWQLLFTNLNDWLNPNQN
jgi:HlyD family secretion protein